MVLVLLISDVFSGRFDALLCQAYFLTLLELAVLAQILTSFDCQIAILLGLTFKAGVNVLSDGIHIEDPASSANDKSCLALLELVASYARHGNFCQNCV